MHRNDVLFAALIQFENFDAARQNEEPVDAALAAFEHLRAGGQALLLPVDGDTRGHIIVEAREHLRLAFV